MNEKIRGASRARKTIRDYMTKHTIMESVKIDYLVEKYFQGKPVLQKKRNYVFIFLHRMLRSI
jgi:ribosomal protein L31E